ncbi:hypothetical protein [Sediminibacterium goheungense]|uniref:Uncharacterized protein n=1 Tax=Sediminibacterium goheungense TaxID=1086393 RepID=A0A4R6J3L6_9BACT|nr:hypothetical protein [Sediminibacterium goheungense]TDO28775.1 hypothetical protein BC659_0855 [Sediminibacterium goheungense]
MVLYRAVSTAEKDDIQIHKQFRTQINTLEAKQFFSSEVAVSEYVAASVKRNFIPPYTYILTVSINEQCFLHVTHNRQELDGHDAISIDQQHLSLFNKFVIFIEPNVIEDSL